MRLSSIVGAAVLSAVFVNGALPAQAAPKASKRATNIVVEAVDLVAGTISGTIAGVPFTTDITNFDLQLLPGHGKQCSVLDLELAPIHLEVLGLHADTSPICLNITAFQGKGLLGDLLCGLAGGGLNLNTIIGDLQTLLKDVLNESLAQSNGGGHGGGKNAAAGMVCTGDCEVLDLVIGPLTLNLLGVRVKLDDCNNGPVEVCISATAAEGLLGQVLCALADGSLLQGITVAELAALIEDLLATL